jgi:hypothetical protein
MANISPVPMANRSPVPMVYGVVATSHDILQEVPLPADNDLLLIEKFKEDLIKVLSAVPGQEIDLQRLPEAFTRHFKRPFALAEYRAKKIIQLLREIPDIVQVLLHK